MTGQNGDGGKKKQFEYVYERFKEDIWKQKATFSDLKSAFIGVNDSKKKFCDHYLKEASMNTSILRDIEEIREDAEIVFSKALTNATRLPIQDRSKIAALEGSAVLEKKIIGKDDIDISKLIDTLGNSDWVQQGRRYFAQLEDQCPFCQQETDESFRQSLEDYFDETYVADLASIDNLQSDYADAADKLLSAYSVTEIVDSPYVNAEALKKDLAALSLALDKNIERIKAKRKEPSTPTTLDDTAPLFSAVEAHIAAANKKIDANNETIANLSVRRRELTSQVWKRLLKDTEAIYDRFKSESDALYKAIESLERKIEKEELNLSEKIALIEDYERKITSIKPTIDAINKLLKSFGFTNFYLTENEKGGFYEVKRPDGRDAKQTLSEGEKSFITFLYFYNLVRGSFSSTGSTNDKVIVFDDPVSSLDSDILFIVSNLIKRVVAEMRGNASAVKQVFVLTHNVYFHKEVTFEKNSSTTKARKAKNYETFWVVRKTSQRSELIRFDENPIKSSYELLWREVRQKPASDTAIQNVMRRILEHYFKFYGGINPEEIVEKFDGNDKGHL